MILGSGGNARQLLEGELVQPRLLCGARESRPAAGQIVPGGGKRFGYRDQLCALARPFWPRRGSGGRTIQIGAGKFTVIGVAPPSFRGIVLDWADPPRCGRRSSSTRRRRPSFRSTSCAAHRGSFPLGASSGFSGCAPETQQRPYGVNKEAAALAFARSKRSERTIGPQQRCGAQVPHSLQCSPCDRRCPGGMPRNRSGGNGPNSGSSSTGLSAAHPSGQSEQGAGSGYKTLIALRPLSSDPGRLLTIGQTASLVPSDGGAEKWGHYGREKGASDVVTLWPY